MTSFGANSKKPHFLPNFGTFLTFSQQFLKNKALSLPLHYSYLSFKKKGEKTIKPILRTLCYVHTYVRSTDQTEFLGPPTVRGSKNLIQN